MKYKTTKCAFYALLVSVFVSTAVLFPRATQAEDVWPWPLSVTCPLNVKNLSGCGSLTVVLPDTLNLSR